MTVRHGPNGGVWDDEGLARRPVDYCGTPALQKAAWMEADAKAEEIARELAESRRLNRPARRRRLVATLLVTVVVAAALAIARIVL